MIPPSFKLHIDPSLYGFKFTGAHYATVKYDTEKVGDNVSIYVFGIEMGPLLYCAITDREKLVKEAEAAARVNAIEYWQNQPADILTTIIKVHAPYLK